MPHFKPHPSSDQQPARLVRQHERGASLVNYGLVVGLVAIVAITAITSVGGSIDTLFGNVESKLSDVVTDNVGTPVPSPSTSPSPSGPLYSFTSQVFDNCGLSGPTGPSTTDCRNDAQYTEAWTDDDNYFTVIGGIQQWTVPETATYRIEALGAGQSSTCGGARMTADFALTQGDVIQILVGQLGNNVSASGGTFVATSGNSPLIVAGGGGGRCSVSASAPTTAESGKTADGNSPGAGGTNGNGGDGGYTPGGGGFYSSGTLGIYGQQDPGDGFLQGGQGGIPTHGSSHSGGFGGGGSGGEGGHYGGGGGYSGGGGSGNGGSGSGGGGGSFSAESLVNSANSTNVGAGRVTITKQ